MDSILSYFKENGLGLLGSVAASVATGNPAPLIAKVAASLGTDPTEEAVSAELSKNNPETLLKLRELESTERRELVRMAYEHDESNLKTVNETIRAELAQQDLYTKRWRPTFGYVVAGSWGIMWLAVVLAIIFYPDRAPAVINALGNTVMMWGPALAVLGVSVHKRSQDKQVAAGQVPSGIMDIFKRGK